MQDIYTTGRLIALAVVMLAFAATGAQAQELPLGSSLPSATLESTGGGQASLSSLTGGKGTVVLFWSNQCPWVDKYEDRVKQLVSQYRGQGFNFVLINPNDPSAFPKENLEASQERARTKGYQQMTYLMDSDASAAQTFGASRAPHAYVFDANNTLAYVGAIDDSPGDPSNVQKTYLSDALSALAQGQDVSVAQTKAFGCTIKFPN